MSAAALTIVPGIDHFSVSGITTYLKCPRQYEHRYILRTPPAHRPGNLAFGSAVHSSLALFYSRLMGGFDEPTHEELAQEFADSWKRELESDIPVLLDEKDTPEILLDRGVGMLEVFCEKAPRPHRVLSVEDSFSVELPTPPGHGYLPRFVGRIDSLVEDSDGSCRLLEHKTAARRYSESKLAYDLQPTAYSLALRQMGIEAQVTFQVLLKTKTPALAIHDVSRTEQDHADLIETIIGVHRAVEAGAFYPVRDWWCKSCQYAGPCLAG